MRNNNQLVTRRGGYTYGDGLVTNVSQADIESLKKQIEALAEQIRDLEKQAREAGMISDEETDDEVHTVSPSVNVLADDEYVQFVYPIDGVPASVATNARTGSGGVYLSTNRDFEADVGDESVVSLVIPLPS